MTTASASITETGSAKKLIRVLHELAQWGLNHTGAETIGELLRQMVDHDQGNPAWEELATTKLSRLAGPEAKAAAALREWAAGLEPDEQQVFMNLTGHPQAKPAGEPERPGTDTQIRFRKKLSDFVRSPEGNPVSQRVREIREVIGPAIAQEEADAALDLSPETEPLRELFLTLAGPYEKDNGWLVLASARRDDPTREILETARDGTASAGLASYRLRAWGLPMERHIPWLTKDGRVRAEDGKLLLWGAALQDRAVFALAEMGRPSTAQEILNHLGEVGNRETLNGPLGRDARFAKAGPKTWALTSWNLPVYLGAVRNMREVLEAREDRESMDASELIAIVRDTFGVAESSLREYVAASMFVCDGATIRLRTKNDPQSEPPPEGPLSQHGTFRLGERRAAKAVRISQSILKGTGQALGSQLGAILGIRINETRTLRTPEGEEVALTCPGTAPKGPFLGSVRKPVLRRRGGEGDVLTMVIDLNDDSLELRVTRQEETGRNWGKVGRLTGLGERACAAALAEALMCREWETKRFLENRGDRWVAEAMPPGWGEGLGKAAKKDDEGEEGADAGEPAAEDMDETPVEAANEPAAEAPSEPADETAKEPAAAAVNEPEKEATDGTTADAVGAPVKEAARGPVDEAWDEAVKERPEETATEPAAEAWEGPADEAADEPAAEAIAAAPDEQKHEAQPDDETQEEKKPPTRKEQRRIADQQWRATARERGVCQKRCGRKVEPGSTRCRECNQKQDDWRENRKNKGKALPAAA